MAPGSLFSASIRTLLCARCAEPLTTTLEARDLACPRCGQSHELGPRESGSRSEFQGTESERLARLVAQDGQAEPTPPGLEHLGKAIKPETADRAWLDWKQARAEVAAGKNGSTAERLSWLTVALRNYLLDQNQDRKLRAMLETALDVLAQPAHRQVHYCLLARGAMGERDFASAERWLARCDPRSVDLPADSEYRVTRAYLETHRRNPRGVLDVLGERIESVPVSDANDYLAAVLRANALELRGQVDEAAEQLVRMMAGGGTKIIALVIEGNRELDLCPQSNPRAQEVLPERQKVARQLALGRGLALRGGVIWFYVAFGEAALAAVLGLLAIVGVTPIPGMPQEAMAVAAVVLLAMAGPLFWMGIRARRGAAQVRRLWAKGIEARARVLIAKPTGTQIHGQPELLMALTVFAPDRPPYRAVHREVVGRQGLEVAPGMNLPVRIDPVDPGQMLVEWERVVETAPDGIAPAKAGAGRRLRLSVGSLGVVLAALAGVFLFGRAGACMGFEEVALQRLNACPLAVSLLGSPIESTFLGLSCGSASTEGSFGKASWMLPVAGPTASGSYKVVMEKRGGPWILLEGYLNAGDQEVDVAQCVLSAGGMGVSERRQQAGTVVSTMGEPPVAKGASCNVVIGPGGGPFGCRIEITCDGKLLYGGENRGYLHCRQELAPDGGLPMVSAQDNETTAVSGDPMLDFRERKGEILVSDQSPSGMWGVTIQLARPAAR